VQPSAPPPSSDPSRWVFPIVAVVGLAFAILFFFQTHDPMILIFGLMAIFIASLIFRSRRWMWGYGPMWAVGPAQPPAEVVKVRCPACRALNEENARFCHQCGKPM
jgi:hypothetical protein